MRRYLLPVVLLPLLALSACGGGTTEVRISPFTAEHGEVFEDGLDFVADPEGLEGRWREEWSRDLDRRVTWSDVIAIVTVSTLQTSTDPDQRTTYRLVTQVGRQLLGEVPPEVEMIVREDGTGFTTVADNTRRILDSEFIAFLKWYEPAEGGVAPHWHLSPSSDPVVSRTEYLIERRHDIPREPEFQRTTTIVHE
jgi:hypothetical protein